MSQNKKKSKVYAKDLIDDPNVPDYIKQKIKQGSEPKAERGDARTPPDRGAPLKQKVKTRFKEYFKPMTPEEAAADEELRKKSREGSGPDPQTPRSISHSRFGRDIQRFRKASATAIEKHAQWVEEGNKKQGKQSKQGKSKPNPTPPSMMGGMDIDEDMLTGLITGGSRGGGRSPGSGRSRTSYPSSGRDDLMETMGFGGSSGRPLKSSSNPLVADQDLLRVMGFGGESSSRRRK